MQKQSNNHIFEDVLLQSKETEILIKEGKFAEAAHLLFTEQRKSWAYLNGGYDALSNILIRNIEFDSFLIKLQYNPNRISSTGALVDEVSLKERECFLCTANLPSEQKGLLYDDTYFILCNPYPIFPEHFTIPNINHFPQSIKTSFKNFLNLGKDLSEHYCVFYNGPRCGASAPDHMHFQAGSRRFLPVTNDYPALKRLYGEEIIKTKEGQVTGIDDGLRKFVAVESKNFNFMTKVFKHLYKILENLFNDVDEPPINIISDYNNESGWRVLFFLRGKHRPSHYYKEGSDKILVSPGAVDMGGICILPLEKDYRGLDRNIITEIFKEVGIGKEFYVYVKSSLGKKLKGIFNSDS